MCGIAGFWDYSELTANLDHSSIVNAMANTITSRGPDDLGIWSDNEVNLNMSHRRLSILDLSEAGHQPMTSPCGRYTIVYNGEIYNFLDIKEELENEFGYSNWKGHSDTEVLIFAFSKWDIEKTLKKLNGMFAFALWDSLNKELYIARDRIGEKPLYYGTCNNIFLFGSQLKALKVHPEWNKKIDRESLSLFLRHGYVPAPNSIYEGINKLEPGHYIKISNNNFFKLEPKCYWNLREIARKSSNNQYKNYASLSNDLESLLKDSVKKRMISDVPIGVFLSGGVDSSIVAGLMQAQSDNPIKTFTIGFHEKKYNEANFAKDIATHLGTEHHELYVSHKDAIDIIPELPKIFDEPFADVSQIPTFLVSKLAKSKISVCLSGDGGDELFYGYTRYMQASNMWSKLKLIPLPLKKFMGYFLKILPQTVIETVAKVFPKKIDYFYDRLLKFSKLLFAKDFISFYSSFISISSHPDNLVLGCNSPESIFKKYNIDSKSSNIEEEMTLLDMMTYLPDDILAKVDRASMHVSLEARVPLLDHRLIELSLRTPYHFKVKNNSGKFILRDLLYNYVPRHLIERPKMGFGVPIEEWIRGPLNDWAKKLLDEERLKREGYFDHKKVALMWSENMSGSRRWHAQIWNILMFQAWLDQN